MSLALSGDTREKCGSTPRRAPRYDEDYLLDVAAQLDHPQCTCFSHGKGMTKTSTSTKKATVIC